VSPVCDVMAHSKGFSGRPQLRLEKGTPINSETRVGCAVHTGNNRQAIDAGFAWRIGLWGVAAVIVAGVFDEMTGGAQSWCE
jgi:hypothetical protein